MQGASVAFTILGIVQKTTWQSLNVDHADDGEAGASEQSLEADHDDTQKGAFALTFELSWELRHLDRSAFWFGAALGYALFLHMACAVEIYFFVYVRCFEPVTLPLDRLWVKVLNA